MNIVENKKKDIFLENIIFFKELKKDIGNIMLWVAYLVLFKKS